MARRIDTLKLNFPGGVIAANDLHTVLSILADFGIGEVRFGTRQQMLVRVPVKLSEKLKTEFGILGFLVEKNCDAYPNIVSSYLCQDLFSSSVNMSEGVYRDILDSFTHTPSIRINIVDGSQSFVPFFTGHLNFISSAVPNYWHLQIQFPKSNLYYSWPGLIYSMDIGPIACIMEKAMKELAGRAGQLNFSVEEFHIRVMNAGSFLMPFSQGLENIPDFKLPYYEGFNQTGSIHWLGIYRRTESFTVKFLTDLCMLSCHCKIAQIYITPWKSLIIKNLDPTYRKLWDGLLGKHRINVRHASNELNWQVEDQSEEALALKRSLVLHFDREDIRTYGLCFAIQTKSSHSIFGSVIIQKQAGKRKYRDRFDILYTRDFNPNARERVIFRTDLTREMLPTYLVSLCKYYYERLDLQSELLHKVFEEGSIRQEEAVAPQRILHQCSACLSVFDPLFGDELAGVEPGINFAELPDTHTCSTCGAPKSWFQEIEEGMLVA